MAISKLSSSTPLVLLGQQTGITVIPAQTPLTRLNYFDGKFLRAQDLQTEQNYLRQLTQLSNQANGFGVVNGFDLALGGGDQLKLGAGLAIDPRGRVLLLGQEQAVSIQELINRSREFTRLLQSATLKATGGFAECEFANTAPTTTAVAGREWYLITIAHAEALCGEEDVYGKLCQEACVTSTDRPFKLEGVVLRALPLLLSTPLAHSSAVTLDRTHLRSLIASAFYSDETKRVGDLISRAGLSAATWCHGAVGLTGNDVAIGVLVRDGNSTLFVDEWIARRELIETSPRRYWQWRMAMRPWDVYLAQILQFQCQLHDGFETGGPDNTDDDPCAEAKRLVSEAATHFKVLSAYYKQTNSKLQRMSKSARDRLLEDGPEVTQSHEQYAAFEARLSQATSAFQLMPRNRLLINLGIVETPSAGYLPVIPGDTISVNDQVRRLMGEGVDLRFCIVRPDYVPHALEEAQHMERISLLRGLDNPNDKPKVDVLVPNGKLGQGNAATGRYYEMRMNLIPENLELLAVAAQLAQQSNAFQKSNLIREAADTSAADTAKTLAEYVALLIRADRKNVQTFEYSGAAHSDDNATGGVSFYYAGVSRPTSVAPTKPTATPATPAAPAAPTAPTAPGAAPEAVVPNNTGAINESFNFNSGMANLIMKRRVRDNAIDVTRNIETRSAIWLSLDIAQDPTELSRNQSTVVKAECFLLLTLTLEGADSLNTRAGGAAKSRTVSEVLRANFTGEFNVEDVAVRTGTTEQREVKGMLAGELTLSMRAGGLQTNQEQSNFSVYLSEPVRVLRSAGANGPIIKIDASDWSFLSPLVGEIEIERKWTAAQQAEALGTIHFNAPQTRGAETLALGATTRTVLRQAFRAWQTVNANVREPQHPAHEEAIRALRSIGSALGSAKFADLSAQRLFPAVKPASSELNVLATLDWVLFHRRREKTCQLDKPVLPIDTRQYALYHVQLDEGHTLAELRRQLERTTANAKLPNLDFVQLVEFGAGIHAVISPHAQVQASWRQDVGNNAGVVVGGFIASRGVAAAEGERLAEERLESLVDVVEPTPTTGVARAFDVLTRVPDALNAASNDGAIIIVTAKPQEKVVTHAVYFFDTQHDSDYNVLLTAALQNDAGRYQAALKNGVLLSKVAFKAGTAEPVGNALEVLLNRWKDETDAGPPLQAEVIYDKALDAGPYDTTLRPIFDESIAIGNKLGYTSPAGGLSYSPAATTLPRPNDSDVLTVFLGRRIQIN